MIECLLIELSFLIGFLEILQPHKIQGLVTNINIANMTELKIRYFDFDDLLNVRLLWSVPLDIFSDDFGELFIQRFGFVLCYDSIRQTNKQKILNIYGK